MADAQSTCTWSITPPYLQLDQLANADQSWTESAIMPSDKSSTRVSAQSAGFSGRISLGRYHLTLPKGTVHPSQSLPPNWKDRLLWHTPEQGEPGLYFVNGEGFLFKLVFEQVEYS